MKDIRKPKVGDRIMIMAPGKEIFGVYKGFGESFGVQCVYLMIEGNNYNCPGLVPIDQIVAVDFLDEEMWNYHLKEIEISQAEWRKQLEYMTHEGLIETIPANRMPGNKTHN